MKNICCHRTGYSLPDCSSVSTFPSSWASVEQCDYLTHLNFKLVHEVNEAEGQKHFFRNKLQNEYRTHTCELEELYAIISQKNDALLHLEQSLDKLKKEYRVLEDDASCQRNNSLADQEFYAKQLQNMKQKHESRAKALEEKLQKEYELKMMKKQAEMEQICEDRVKLYKEQCQKLMENSNQLTHELALMQDKYRDMMLKNDLSIQESINRELRKRDFQSQNNYLRDVSQYQAAIKDNRELREGLQSSQLQLQQAKLKNHHLQALLETERTKYQNLKQALDLQRKERLEIERESRAAEQERRERERECTERGRSEKETNTQQDYLPLVMPVDMDLISEVVSLKQFVMEKIMERFLELFCKTAATPAKKQSYSLTTFAQSVDLLKETSPDIKNILFLHSSLDRVIKTYCPSLSYTREYLTIKDAFIKRTLMECETLQNNKQKLYRILELVHRLRHPVTHCKSEISPGELRMIEVKLLAVLRKVFGPQP